MRRETLLPFLALLAGCDDSASEQPDGDPAPVALPDAPPPATPATAPDTTALYTLSGVMICSEDRPLPDGQVVVYDYEPDMCSGYTCHVPEDWIGETTTQSSGAFVVQIPTDAVEGRSLWISGWPAYGFTCGDGFELVWPVELPRADKAGIVLDVSVFRL